MLWHVLELCDVVMVFGLLYCLRCCWSCRLFWLIQAFQLCEVGNIMRHHYAFETIFSWDSLNLTLDGLAALLAWRHFPLASWMMAIYVFLKAVELSDVYVPWEMVHDAAFWTRFALNEAIMFALIGYAVRRATLRLWSSYARAPA